MNERTPLKNMESHDDSHPFFPQFGGHGQLMEQRRHQLCWILRTETFCSSPLINFFEQQKSQRLDCEFEVRKG